MKKYSTIIFDLDGTLLNTLEDLTDSVNYALSTMNYEHRTMAEVRSMVGNGVRKLIERAVPAKTQLEDIDKTFTIFKNHYAANCNNKTMPYDGIIELIEELLDRNIKIAIVSNKIDSAVKELVVQYFNGYFTTAIGEKDGIQKKPAGDMVFAAIRELDADIKNALYVGDSEVDAMTAANAGMDCILVSWGFRDRDVLVRYSSVDIIDKAADLLKYI